MIFCGIPIFFQEVALGQYLGVGGMTLIGELVPIMKGKRDTVDALGLCVVQYIYHVFVVAFDTGVGYATMVVVVLIDVYYTVIIAWTVFYLAASFTALPSLPWASCSTYPDYSFILKRIKSSRKLIRYYLLRFNNFIIIL